MNRNSGNGVFDKSGKEILNALTSVLIVGVVYFPFILPWVLWKKSTLILSRLFSGYGVLKTIEKSDFSFFAWLRYFLHSLVFSSWVAGPVLIIIWSSSHGMPGFVKSFLLFYFLPVVLHFFIEIISSIVKIPVLESNEKSSNIGY